MEGLKRETKIQAAPGCRWLALLVLFVASLSTLGLAASPEDSSESLVKAAYLVKFAEFVEWPPSVFPEPDTPFIVGILGRDPFGAKLDEMVRDRTVQGRPVVIRRYDKAGEADQIHILYISPTTPKQLNLILKILRGRSILTVSDGSRTSSGVINFILVNNQVRFEIDSESATRADLKISSKLLDLATAAGDGR